MSADRVWGTGAVEPLDNGLRLIDATSLSLAQNGAEWLRDPSWFRRGDGVWSGPYGYKLTWENLLAEHGPMTEYKRPEEVGRE